MPVPLISIGLPVFNGEGHLAQAVDSLLAQRLDDFEIIISDNGSIDATPQICRDYAAKDQRIKYYRNEINRGVIWNFHNVFQLASADYFMWAAYDDYWDPAFLQTCLEAFNRSNTVILAGSACDSINADTSQIILTDYGVTTVGLKPAARFRKYKQALHTGKNVNALFNGVYRKNILAKLMPLETTMFMDHTVLAELSLLGEFYTSEKRLMKKRWGGGSLSFEKSARSLQITNPLVIHSVYLMREVSLQKVIFVSKGLTFLEKINLSFWSWGNYLILFLRLKYRLVRDFIKSILRLGNRSLTREG